MLKLNEDIHKILISTPAKFVGSYLSDDTSIQLSFPIQSESLLSNISENPYSRTFMVITFEYKPDNPMIRQDLSAYGEYFCALLSILYGKEFKFHGMLETHGFHRLPNTNIESNRLYYLPQYNYQPRKDLGIPLNLEQFNLIEPIILEGKVSLDFVRMIIAAGKFYNRSLRLFPKEPELAYLDLITCGEIISNFNEDQYTEKQLYDERLLKIFEQIATLNNGERIIKDLKNRLYQVKRKFFYSLTQLLNDNFFSQSEAKNEFRIKKDNIEQLIKSAYDLRSKYVHTGLEFGRFVEPEQYHLNEVVLFEPEWLDKEVRKIIAKSPTFLGLERIIRYALLRLIHKNGIKINNLLD